MVINKFTKKKTQKTCFLESISRKKRLSSQKSGKSGAGTKPVNWNSRKLTWRNWQFGKLGLGEIEFQENGIRPNNH